MDRAVLENASLVLDGVSIVPGLIDLESYSKKADVFFLVVATLDDEAYQIMPDIVTYDDYGNETSRTPATSNDDLRDINLIAGQHVRLFHVNEGPI